MSRLQDAILASGLFAARPAFGSEGRLYYATDTTILYRDTGIAWETYSGPSGAHDILSATHSDADPQAVTRGSLIYGDATPEWTELVIGAASRVLTVNAGGTEPEWAIPGTGVWAFIAETILGAPAASVNFAAIPGAYRALVVHGQARSSVAAENDNVDVRLNADAGANYDWIQLVGTGGAASSVATRATNQMRLGHIDGATARANNWPSFLITILGYALADREKWAVCNGAGAFGDVSADADLFIIKRRARWRNTAAVTALLLLPANGPNFATGSRFALYGVT